MNKPIVAFVICSVILASGYAREYHVAKKGSDKNTGTKNSPFVTINHAAQIAKAGDTITVHSGVYREQVNPINGGTAGNKRITYRAAANEKVEIKGSEIITGWQQDGELWKKTIPDDFFGNYNPYRDQIAGDWYFGNMNPHLFGFSNWVFEKNLHTGEVYINGKALHEKDALNKLIEKNTWFCAPQDDCTVIYANFAEHNPNREVVEINVRPTIFYPSQTGRNYITVKGFIMSQAATQWAAPTAEQIGIIGTNWSKGWIMEDNVISQSKCVGITLGKDKASGHNPWSKQRQQDGSVMYNEIIHRVMNSGWNKENIGSHIVRNNTIFNCGAAGICGSFGAAYSEISHNHVYDIYTYRPYWGAEMGGIKIHGAIDAVIKNNRVHNCYQGIWLDWMAQGTRVTANLCYDNDYVDFFTEVNHGPYVVDNNIFLSKYTIKDWSEGGAYAHNIIAGMVSCAAQKRETPWFAPHTTHWAGISNIKGGDNHFYNNIFIGNGSSETFTRTKYLPADAIDENRGYGLNMYDHAALPVYAEGNIYYNGAIPLSAEKHAVTGNSDPQLSVQLMNDKVYLRVKMDRDACKYSRSMVTSDVLGRAIVPNQRFENADSSLLSMDKDYHGNRINSAQIFAGPFQQLIYGGQSVRVW